jgi:hypothetical protein
MSEVKKVVNEINGKLIMDAVSESGYFSYLELVSTPIGDYIKYMGQCVWDSENDYREWIDEDNQEPLEGYLVKQIIEINKVILGSLRVLEARYKAVAKIMVSRLKGDGLRSNILERTQTFVDNQNK